ncbi:hypothetical protein POM88_023220 [Heracleum sosnowskyi]|uniref:hAT-like transposase RNase-H fold domain-containing protein n=1 Tax=Heracleum sosnowskyi TaxID=360622 RepID=A0AAD8MQA2_9APIA|nr:hypothetical protein POM88_023220 [Heracleum sosnowskyi]
MGEDDSKYASYFNGSSDNKDPPSDYDWLKARIFVKFLKIFYQVTLKFSGSLYVTSNIFFHEIVEIHANLSNLMSSGDMLLSRMAERMKLKFEKYWENYKNINFLLYIAVVLDPRFKLRYVQFCFSQLYDNRKCTEMIMYVETALNKLFANYEQEHSKEQGNFNHSDVQDKNVVGCENSTTMAAKFLEQMREDDQQDSKSDLSEFGGVEGLDSDRSLSLWAPILLGMMNNPRRRRRIGRLPEDDDDEEVQGGDEEQEHHDRHQHHHPEGESELDRELESIIRRRRRSSATILQLQVVHEFNSK